MGAWAGPRIVTAANVITVVRTILATALGLAATGAEPKARLLLLLVAGRVLAR